MMWDFGHFDNQTGRVLIQMGPVSSGQSQSIPTNFTLSPVSVNDMDVYCRFGYALTVLGMAYICQLL